MGDIRKISIPEFHAELKAQGVASREDVAFRCPVCSTVQSMRSLVAAGAGDTAADVEKYVGFSCVGRWTGAGPFNPKKPDRHGCDWTLGGLFQLHCLEVIDEEGNAHPRFEPATPDEAKTLAASSPAGREALAAAEGRKDG
jgi:hypothetical protein